jgi:CheY-like chemotaxis protein
MTNVKKTVLIVEDSPTQSLSLQLLLENEGLNVLHTPDGIPIIILTKLDDSNSMRKSLILGAIEFIPKDIFAETVLLETLKQLKILEKTSIDV